MDELLGDIELFTGIQCKIPLCCILFYESVWLPSIRAEIKEYSEKMWNLSNHSGILLCPSCLIDNVKKNHLRISVTNIS